MEAGDRDLFEYKSKLHEYAQKSKHPCPVYTVEKEGFAHAPQFRAAVCVAGQVFKSSHAFRQVKIAEHSVARLAFEALTSQSQSEVDPTVVLQDIDIVQSKSILYEYNVKKGLCQPVYNTNAPAGEVGYISSIRIEENIYTGPISKSKREAEQCVAHVAITSILENPETKGLMMEIIRSKLKARHALNANPNPNLGILDSSESRSRMLEVAKSKNRSNYFSQSSTDLKASNQTNQETCTDLKATNQTNQETCTDLKASNQKNQETCTDLKATNLTNQETCTDLKASNQTNQETCTDLKATNQTNQETGTDLKATNPTNQETCTDLKATNQTNQETGLYLRATNQTNPETCTDLKAKNPTNEEEETCTDLKAENQANKETCTDLKASKHIKHETSAIKRPHKNNNKRVVKKLKMEEPPMVPKMAGEQRCSARLKLKNVGPPLPPDQKAEMLKYKEISVERKRKTIMDRQVTKNLRRDREKQKSNEARTQG